MKKLILSSALLCAITTAKAQWTYKNVDNGIDEPYKICYTESNNSAYLKLENYEGKVMFYISGSYFCEDFPTADIVFTVSGETKKHQVIGARSKDSKLVFLSFDIASEEFYEDFKKASSVKVRVNETYCTTDVFTFNMANSKSALEFMLKP
jgi:hypothetical protein